MDSNYLDLQRFMRGGSRRSIDPEEIYAQWEYTFLRLGLVSSTKEFADMLIPCTLDLIDRVQKEFQEVRR